MLISFVLHLGTMSYVYFPLSYDVAVLQWITSCHKNRKTTRVITFRRVQVTSFTLSVSTMRLHIEIIFILNAIKPILKVDLINRIAEGSFHTFHMKWIFV